MQILKFNGNNAQTKAYTWCFMSTDRSMATYVDNVTKKHNHYRSLIGGQEKIILSVNVEITENSNVIQ